VANRLVEEASVRVDNWSGLEEGDESGKGMANGSARAKEDKRDNLRSKSVEVDDDV
jgi:hypothetical protein